MLNICTICARGGSKGVPNKNIKNLIDKPLIAHSLIQAQKTGLFDEIAVSSDSPEILAIAEQWGATILIHRAAELATDTAPKIPVIQDCVRQAEALTKKSFDIVVDLSSTSPLRSEKDIENAVQLLHERNASNIITGCHSRCSPYFSLVELNNDGTPVLSKKPETPIFTRQSSPQTFDMNGSIYVWHKDILLKNNMLFLERTKLYVMPEERSVDIDTPMDWDIVEFLMAKKNPN